MSRRPAATTAARPGVTTGSGRPASSSGPRWAPRRRSPAATPRRPRGAAWSTGRRSSGSRSGGCAPRRAPSTPPSCGPPNPPTPRPWPGSCRRSPPPSGAQLPGVVERAGVVDRAGWVRANTGSFASLMSKLETDLLDQVIPPGGGLAKATMALANRWVTTRQLGFLLGFMGTPRPGPVRPRPAVDRGGAREAAVRRGEHPGDGPRAGRADRPVPDLDRPARDDPRLRVRGASRGSGRTSRSASSASSRCSARTPAGSAARRSAASAAPSAARPAASTGSRR